MTLHPELVGRRTAKMLWLSIGWFAMSLLLGLPKIIASPSATPPLVLALTAVVPPILAVGLLTASPRFRAWAQSRDLTMLTELQGWRLVGLAFLALAAVGVLPLGFALPAGIGDLLVGFTAPIVAIGLKRGTLRRSAYVAWTAFGILDLITALTLGAFYSDSVMAQLPMSLIPTFVVPFLLVIHVISLTALAWQYSPVRNAA